MKRSLILLAIFAISGIVACKKEPNRNTAGKGGNATLIVYPAHHGHSENLIDVKVYVAFNTLNAPTNGGFDDSLTCDYTNGLVTCRVKELQNGDYYLFCSGYDTSISQGVKGGIPYSVTQQGGETIVKVPVSEN